MIKVVICDDQIIVTEGLAKILSTAKEMEILGTAYNGEEAIALTNQHTPDLVLMDLKMPIMNGITATRKIKQTSPDTKILILTTYDDDEWLFDALRVGADGYLLKDTPPEDLLKAIHGTITGKAYIDPNITSKVIKNVSRATSPKNKTIYNLSPREQEILKLIAQGLSNADIADRLYLSEGTIRNYTSNLFQKLGVSDRTQAAVVAIKHGLIDQQDL